MINQRIRFLVLLVLVVSVVGLAAAEVNRIVLRVNDRIATLHDYERAKQDRIDELRRRGVSSEELQQRLAELGEQTMHELFEEMLLLSRADQLDIRLSPSQLAEAVEQAKKNFRVETDEDFDRGLAQSGMTRDGFTEQIENSSRMREVFSLEVYSELNVQEEDLRRYYGSHPEEFAEPSASQLRELVVLESSGLSETQLQATAASLAEAIESGEEAPLLDALKTAGTSTGWIELGWIDVADLDPQLATAVESLEVGQLSAPTPARGGLHLLQVQDHRLARVKDFAEVRDQIEQAERDRRYQARLAEYMTELEESSYILAYPPPEAAGFRAASGVEDPAEVPALAPIDPPENGDA